MKNKTKLQNCSDKILNIVRDYNLTPTQLRYVFSKVRTTGKFQIPKNRKKLPSYLTAPEIYTILNIEKDQFNIIFFNFGINTGFRISEIANLLIQDIDFEGNQIKVVNGKGGKDRNVVLLPKLKQLLRLHIGSRRSGYVFCKKNEKKYTTRALEYRYKNIAQNAGLNKAKHHPHIMRHTFATVSLSLGVPLADIQINLGHSSYKTTEIYTHLELGHVKERYIQLMGDK